MNRDYINLTCQAENPRLKIVFRSRPHFCFEKNGVLANVNDNQSVIAKITPDTYTKLKSQGIIADGMLPKLENAFDALHFGVEKVVIEHALRIHGKLKTTVCLN